MGQESHLSSSAPSLRRRRLRPTQHRRPHRAGPSDPARPGQRAWRLRERKGSLFFRSTVFRQLMIVRYACRSVAGCRRSPLPRGRRPASRCSSSPVLLQPRMPSGPQDRYGWQTPCGGQCHGPGLYLDQHAFPRWHRVPPQSSVRIPCPFPEVFAQRENR
jgi:hypothetical protein